MNLTFAKEGKTVGTYYYLAAKQQILYSQVVNIYPQVVNMCTQPLNIYPQAANIKYTTMKVNVRFM